MDFPSFLLRKQWLQKDEYLRLTWRAMKGAEGATSDNFLRPSIDELDVSEFDRLRSFPFGDVLRTYEEILSQVLTRSGAEDFDELVCRWHEWHVIYAQPISDFGLSPADPTPFGKRLYKQAEEKRLCGEFVAERLIRDGDYIAVPEGSSTLWLGLAAVARRKMLELITSNGPLVRELLENPVLRRRANGVTVIGGHLDEEYGGSGRGFIGLQTSDTYQDAIQRDPGATVMICSVNGLLPEDGPFAPCAQTGQTRYRVLRSAFDSNVRTVVFVADYSKTRRSKRPSYGVPIFGNRNEWQTLMQNERERIAIVLAPPREVRMNAELLSTPPGQRVPLGQGYPQFVVDYLDVAAAFSGLCAVGAGTNHFYEAVATASVGAAAG